MKDGVSLGASRAQQANLATADAATLKQCAAKMASAVPAARGTPKFAAEEAGILASIDTAPLSLVRVLTPKSLAGSSLSSSSSSYAAATAGHEATIPGVGALSFSSSGDIDVNAVVRRASGRLSTSAASSSGGGGGGGSVLKTATPSPRSPSRGHVRFASAGSLALVSPPPLIAMEMTPTALPRPAATAALAVKSTPPATTPLARPSHRLVLLLGARPHATNDVLAREYAAVRAATEDALHDGATAMARRAAWGGDALRGAVIAGNGRRALAAALTTGMQGGAPRVLHLVCHYREGSGLHLLRLPPASSPPSSSSCVNGRPGSAAPPSSKLYIPLAELAALLAPHVQCGHVHAVVLQGEGTAPAAAELCGLLPTLQAAVGTCPDDHLEGGGASSGRARLAFSRTLFFVLASGRSFGEAFDAANVASTSEMRRGRAAAVLRRQKSQVASSGGGGGSEDSSVFLPLSPSRYSSLCGDFGADDAYELYEGSEAATLRSPAALRPSHASTSSPDRDASPSRTATSPPQAALHSGGGDTAVVPSSSPSSSLFVPSSEALGKLQRAIGQRLQPMPLLPPPTLASALLLPLCARSPAAAPSTLLLPRHRVVKYDPSLTAALVDDFHAWCDEESRPTLPPLSSGGGDGGANPLLVGRGGGGGVPSPTPGTTSAPGPALASPTTGSGTGGPSTLRPAHGSGIVSVLRARTYSGPTGAGKTRLFLEQVAAMRERGWAAGFLPSSDDDVAALLTSLPPTPFARPTLIVVDNADARAPMVRALVEYLEMCTAPALAAQFTVPASTIASSPTAGAASGSGGDSRSSTPMAGGRGVGGVDAAVDSAGASGAASPSPSPITATPRVAVGSSGDAAPFSTTSSSPHAESSPTYSSREGTRAAAVLLDSGGYDDDDAEWRGGYRVRVVLLSRAEDVDKRLLLGAGTHVGMVSLPLIDEDERELEDEEGGNGAGPLRTPRQRAFATAFASFAAATAGAMAVTPFAPVSVHLPAPSPEAASPSSVSLSGQIHGSAGRGAAGGSIFFPKEMGGGGGEGGGGDASKSLPSGSPATDSRAAVAVALTPLVPPRPDLSAAMYSRIFFIQAAALSCVLAAWEQQQAEGQGQVVAASQSSPQSQQRASLGGGGVLASPLAIGDPGRLLSPSPFGSLAVIEGSKVPAASSTPRYAPSPIPPSPLSQKLGGLQKAAAPPLLRLQSSVGAKPPPAFPSTPAELAAALLRFEYAAWGRAATLPGVVGGGVGGGSVNWASPASIAPLPSPAPSSTLLPLLTPLKSVVVVPALPVENSGRVGGSGGGVITPSGGGLSGEQKAPRLSLGGGGGGGSSGPNTPSSIAGTPRGGNVYTAREGESRRRIVALISIVDGADEAFLASALATIEGLEAGTADGGDVAVSWARFLRAVYPPPPPLPYALAVAPPVVAVGE